MTSSEQDRHDRLAADDLQSPNFFNGQQYKSFLHNLFVSQNDEQAQDWNVAVRETDYVRQHRQRLGKHSDVYLREDVMPLISSNSDDDMRTPLLKGTRKGIIRAFEVRLKRDIGNSNIKQATVFYRWLSSVPEVKEYMIHAHMSDDSATEPNIYHVLYDLNRLKLLLDSGFVDEVKTYVETTIETSTTRLKNEVQLLKSRFRNHLNTAKDRGRLQKAKTDTNMAPLKTEHSGRVQSSQNQRELGTSVFPAVQQVFPNASNIIQQLGNVIPADTILQQDGLSEISGIPSTLQAVLQEGGGKDDVQFFTQVTIDLFNEINLKLAKFYKIAQNQTDIQNQIVIIAASQELKKWINEKREQINRMPEDGPDYAACIALLDDSLTQTTNMDQFRDDPKLAQEDISMRNGEYTDYTEGASSEQAAIITSNLKEYYEARKKSSSDESSNKYAEAIKFLTDSEEEGTEMKEAVSEGSVTEVLLPVLLTSPPPVVETQDVVNYRAQLEAIEADTQQSKIEKIIQVQKLRTPAHIQEISKAYTDKLAESDVQERNKELLQFETQQISDVTKVKNVLALHTYFRYCVDNAPYGAKEIYEKALREALGRLSKNVENLSPVQQLQRDYAAIESMMKVSDIDNVNKLLALCSLYVKFSDSSKYPENDAEFIQLRNTVFDRIMKWIPGPSDQNQSDVRLFNGLGFQFGLHGLVAMLSVLYVWNGYDPFDNLNPRQSIGILQTETEYLDGKKLDQLQSFDFENLSLANAACLSTAVHFFTQLENKKMVGSESLNDTEQLKLNAAILAGIETPLEKEFVKRSFDRVKNELSSSLKKHLMSFSGAEFVDDVVGYSGESDMTFLEHMGWFANTVLDHPTNRPAVRFRLFCSVCFRSDLMQLRTRKFSVETSTILNRNLEEILDSRLNANHDPFHPPDSEGRDESFLPMIEKFVLGDTREVQSGSRSLWDQLYKEDHKIQAHDNSMFSRYCIDRGLCGARSPLETNQKSSYLPYNIGSQYPYSSAGNLIDFNTRPKSVLNSKTQLLAADTSKRTNTNKNDSTEFEAHFTAIPDFVDLRDTRTGVQIDKRTSLTENHLQAKPNSYIEPQHSVQWLPKNEDASRACVYEHFIQSVGYFDDGLERELKTEVCCVAKLISLPYVSNAETVVGKNIEGLKTRPCEVDQNNKVKYPVFPGLEKYEIRSGSSTNLVPGSSATHETTKFNLSKRPITSYDNWSVPSSKSRCVSWTGEGSSRVADMRRPIYVEIGGFTINFSEYENLYEPPVSFDPSESETPAATGTKSHFSVYQDIPELQRVIDGAIAACEDHIRHSEASDVLRGMQRADSDREMESVRISRERKQLIWNDALRESYICQDKLYAFVRQFSGTIGEPIESICNVDESKLIQHQTDTRKKREKHQQRVSELHGKLIELFVSVLLKDSGLSFGLSATDDVLRILPSLANKQAMDLLKNPPRDSGLFTNSRNLDALLSRGERELSLEELMKFMKSASESTGDTGDMDVDGDDVAEPESLESLSAARNSLMLRYSTEAKAAMRKAYDLLQTECRCSQVYDCRRRPGAYELIEGDNSELSNAFAQLCAHVLVKHRMTSTSISAYITRTAVALNTQQVYMSLQKCTRVISEL